MARASESLFDVDLPDGVRYQDQLITADDEAAIVREVAPLEFSTFEMRGVAARRRVLFFGRSYNTGGAVIAVMPPFLTELRNVVADWAGIDPQAFEMALINEYSPGTPIGWHRDSPQYDIVAGVSLLSSCRMKFRPYRSSGSPDASQTRRTATHQITLAPRSAYLITGDARNNYEHHIPAVAALRYSITFRTLRTR